MSLLYEVFRRVLQQTDESRALQAVAAMQQGLVVDLEATFTLSAAKISVDLGHPMADSAMLATTRAHNATLWTQDADFEGLDGAEYRKRPP